MYALPSLNHCNKFLLRFPSTEEIICLHDCSLSSAAYTHLSKQEQLSLPSYLLDSIDSIPNTLVTNNVITDRNRFLMWNLQEEKKIDNICEKFFLHHYNREMSHLLSSDEFCKYYSIWSIRQYQQFQKEADPAIKDDLPVAVGNFSKYVDALKFHKFKEKSAEKSSELRAIQETAIWRKEYDDLFDDFVSIFYLPLQGQRYEGFFPRYQFSMSLLFATQVLGDYARLVNGSLKIHICMPRLQPVIKKLIRCWTEFQSTENQSKNMQMVQEKFYKILEPYFRCMV